MKNFEFSLPTQIVFGREAEKQAGVRMAAFGSRVLILYGSERIRKNGLLGLIEKALADAGVTSMTFGGIVENPLLETAERACELVRKHQIDGLLAIGGGSVVDTAKAVSIGCCNTSPLWQFYTGQSVPEKALPIGVVLTMAATASEANAVSVLTNETLHQKRMFASPLLLPKFALMNPELTYSVPAGQTAIGAIDIFAHAFERYFDLEQKGVLRDQLCAAVMKTVVKVLPEVLGNPEDYDGRSQLMWAATMAHSDIIGQEGVFACHEMSHTLTEVYGISHGAALAILMPAWCEYLMSRTQAELTKFTAFAEFAEQVWGINRAEMSDRQAAEKGLQCFRLFIRQMGLPQNLMQCGINPNKTEVNDAETNDTEINDTETNDIELLVSLTMDGRDFLGECFTPLSRADIREIFKLAASQTMPC